MMETMNEIKARLEALSAEDRERLSIWLEELDEKGPRKVSEAVARYEVEPAYLTVEEFLALEETSNVRHEYVHGARYAMCHPNVRHGKIIGNLYTAFRSRLRGTPCEPYLAGLQARLEISRADVIYVPDLMVVCGREGVGEDYVSSPKVVVEVLSRSTQTIDRREKLLSYMQLPSVEDYWVVSQRSVEIMVHRRAKQFAGERIQGREAIVEIASLELSIPLTEIYEGMN